MRSSDRRSANGLAGHWRGIGILVALLVVLLAQPLLVSADGGSEQMAMTQSQRQARLQAMTPEQRVQFGQRLAAWNALPSSEREVRRTRYQAWVQLDANERVSL